MTQMIIANVIMIAVAFSTTPSRRVPKDELVKKLEQIEMIIKDNEDEK